MIRTKPRLSCCHHDSHVIVRSSRARMALQARLRPDLCCRLHPLFFLLVASSRSCPVPGWTSALLGPNYSPLCTSYAALIPWSIVRFSCNYCESLFSCNSCTGMHQRMICTRYVLDSGYYYIPLGPVHSDNTNYKRVLIMVRACSTRQRKLCALPYRYLQWSATGELSSPNLASPVASFEGCCKRHFHRQCFPLKPPRIDYVNI